MKTAIALSLLLVSFGAAAQVHVNGYVKKDGTYVAPHERTAPNSTPNDNYSTKGNVNPYTGKEGTVAPQATYQYVPPPQPQYVPPANNYVPPKPRY